MAVCDEKVNTAHLTLFSNPQQQSCHHSVCAHRSAIVRTCTILNQHVVYLVQQRLLTMIIAVIGDRVSKRITACVDAEYNAPM